MCLLRLCGSCPTGGSKSRKGRICRRSLAASVVTVRFYFAQATSRRLRSPLKRLHQSQRTCPGRQMNGIYYFQTVPQIRTSEDGCRAFDSANGGLFL